MLADNVNTSLDTAIVPDGNAVMPATPTIQSEGAALSSFMGNTNGGAAVNTLIYDIVKSNAVTDQQEYHARQNGVGSKTVDWIWYQMATT